MRLGRNLALLSAGMNSEYLPWKMLAAEVTVGIGSEDWTLDAVSEEDSPDRTYEVAVSFSAPFSAPPVVHLGLTGFDLEQWSSSRLTLSVACVSESGFTARLTTWRSSRVYGASFQWLAVGA